jgi:hypothetical protein
MFGNHIKVHRMKLETYGSEDREYKKKATSRNYEKVKVETKKVGSFVGGLLNNYKANLEREKKNKVNNEDYFRY